MRSNDLQDFTRQVEVLCAGFNVPPTEQRIEALWRGLQHMDLTVFTRVVECALAGGTEKLRTLNLALETVQPVANWLDTLRAYAGCWIVQSGADLKLVSDKAGSSVASILHASGHIQRLESLTNRCMAGLEGALERIAAGDLTVEVTPVTTPVAVAPSFME